MSRIKEPKFFLTGGPPPVQGGPGDAKTYREHVWRRAEYEALFEAAPPGTLRGASTSSMRTIQLPSCARASRKLASALTSEPACSGPVGEGAKRPR